MDTDRNLLFGVIAVQRGLITSKQFSEAAAAWASRQSETELSSLLIDRGWINQRQRGALEAVLNIQIEENEGDARQTLSEAIDPESLKAIQAARRDEFGLMETYIKPEGLIARTSGSSSFDASSSRYALSRMTGEGGQGRVWIGRDLDLNRQVAVKEIKPEYASESDVVTRFVREAQITGQLEHPNIIPIYELSQNPADGRPYYSMKFIRGQTLKGKIRAYHENRKAGENEQISLHRMLRYFVLMCEAMAYAHSRGVLHRDLKPDNVMIGRFGEVTILDWGLAKVDTSQDESVEVSQVEVSEKGQVTETGTGKILGTPAYMAPEQASGRLDLIDNRTDVYGLGAMLFELLGGRVPHKGKTLLELLSTIATSEPPSARALVPTVPRALDCICRRAMALDRDDRYQSADALADDVACWLADEPVDKGTYREPFSQRLFRWLRRNRGWTVSGGVALLLITVTTAVSAVVVNEARQRESIARGEAIERLQETRKAVDVSLTGMSEVLAYFPSAQSARQHLLERAVSDYERLASVSSDDPELKREAGRALIRLGSLYGELDQNAKALKTFKNADRLFAELVSLSPNEPGIANDRATTIAKLASTHAEDGNLSTAEASFRKSLDLFERIDPGCLDDPLQLRARAAAHVDFGRLLIRNDRPDEAREQLNAAISHLTDNQQVDDDSVKSQLAVAWHAFGQLELRDDAPAAACQALENAIANYEELLDRTPNHPAWLDGRALCRTTLGTTRRRLGQDMQAVTDSITAVKELKELTLAIPGVPHYERATAIAASDAALLLHSLGRTVEARQLAEQSITTLTRVAEQGGSDELDYAAATAYAAYGVVLRELDDLQPAAEAFQLALELLDRIPDDRISVIHLRQTGIVYSHVAGIQDLVGATEESTNAFRASERILRELLTNDPDDQLTKNALAWAYRHEGDRAFRNDQSQEATTLYLSAIALWDDLPLHLELQLGRLWLLLACPDQSVRDASAAAEITQQIAQEIEPTPRLLQLTALSSYRNGSFNAADSEAAQSVKLQPAASAVAFLVRAMSLEKLGKPVDARKMLQQGLAQATTQHRGNALVGSILEEAALLLKVKLPETIDDSNQ